MRIAAVKKQDIRFISKNLLKEKATVQISGLLQGMRKKIGRGLRTGAEFLGPKHGFKFFPGIKPGGNFFIGGGMVGKSPFGLQDYHVGACIGKPYRRI